MSKTRNLGNLSDFLTAGSTYVTTSTPPQFDNSTNLATTGFVQRAYGSLGSTALILTGNTTLTTSQSGTIFEILGTSAAPVITLPAASAQTLVSYTIVNTGTTYGFSITSASNIYLNGATNTTWSLPIGSMIQVFSDGASWIVVNMGGVSTTAPQFDNSARNATTSFLQRALGNYAGAIAYSATSTQPASDFGKLVELSSGSTFTLTTPSFTGVPSGSSMIYANVGTAAVTINAGAGMTFNMNGTGGLTTFTLQVGQIIEFVFDGTSFLAVGGTGNAYLSAAGYQKLPSGLIIQWGELVTPGSSGTLTFPITFPNASLMVIGNPYNSSATAANVTFSTVGAGAKSSTPYYQNTTTAFGWIAIGY